MSARQTGQLVLAAGISPEWLKDGFEVAIEGLATYYGKLSYTLRLEDSDTLHFNLREGISVPPGGIVVKPPLPLPIREVEVNGRATEVLPMQASPLMNARQR